MGNTLVFLLVKTFSAGAGAMGEDMASPAPSLGLGRMKSSSFSEPVQFSLAVELCVSDRCPAQGQNSLSLMTPCIWKTKAEYF